jgi:hypothetical protein
MSLTEQVLVGLQKALSTDERTAGELLLTQVKKLFFAGNSKQQLILTFFKAFPKHRLRYYDLEYFQRC